MVAIIESLLSFWRQISVKGCHKSCDVQPHFWPVGKRVLKARKLNWTCVCDLPKIFLYIVITVR